MADTFVATSTGSLVPSVLSHHHLPSSSSNSHSRPSTPSRNSSGSSGGAAQAPLNLFDDSYLLQSTDFPPVPNMPPRYDLQYTDAGQVGGSLDGPAPFAGAGPPTPARMTRATSAASSGGATNMTAAGGNLLANGGGAGGGGGFVSFDPEKGSGSDVEDDDEDEDERGVAGRPKKRKSVRDLRGAASAQKEEDGGGAGAGKSGGGEENDKARRKIQIEYIEEKSKRHITFSKRKAGIMKKAYELSTLTGTQVLLLVVSESGWVYTFTTDKFKPLVKEDENGQLSQGQKLIAACLEAKDGSPNLAAAAYAPTNAASTGNFEANSAIHGGQISLKTGPRAVRPTATNRRVSSKGRGHVPTPVLTGHPPMDNGLPCPPGSGGIPPVPQLPTPLTGNYLDGGLGSPMSPQGPRGQQQQQQGGPRSLSHPPVSPVRAGYSMQQQQQQMRPAHQQHQQQHSQHEYLDMNQRTEMMHLNYDQQYDLYSSVPPNSAGHLAYSHDPHGGNLPHPPSHMHQQQQHQQQQQQPHTPHRTLHHQASHGHLSSASHQQQQHQQQQHQQDQYEYGLPNPPLSQGNYTHTRDPSISSTSINGNGGGGGVDPRSAPGASGWSTPQGTPQYGIGVGGGEDYGR